MKWIYILTFSLFALISYSQTYRVYGKVVDKETGEAIEGANIYENEGKTGTVSNSYGFYSLSLKPGKQTICCSMIGYELYKSLPEIQKDTIFNIPLSKSNHVLQDVVVSSNQPKRMGHYSLNAQQIKNIPALGGEPDMFKGLLFLPGVNSGNDGSNNLSVRGGNQWQNLILLDEATVYNPNHALSFVSIFNNDALKQVDFFKSYISPMYSGRLSSVVDIKMNEGNNRQYTLKGSVGALSSKLTVEGPLVKDKVSFMVSGRYGYPGTVANAIAKTDLLGNNVGQLEGSEISFYDVSAKVKAKVNDKNHLFLSFYNSKDHFMTSVLIDDYAMNWGNTTTTLRWNSILNDKVNTNALLYFSNYFYDYSQFADGRNYLWKSAMQSYNFRYNVDYYYSNRLKLKFGIGAELFTTRPGEIKKITEDSNIIPHRMERKKGGEFSLFSEFHYKFNTQWSMSGGIRLAANYSFSNAVLPAKWYVAPQPRLEVLYTPDDLSAFTFSANYIVQNMHLLSNSSVGIPSDIWIPANSEIKPSSSLQLTLGYKREIKDKAYSFSVETYYKNMWDIADYKDYADIFMNNEIEEQLVTGRADAYGLEFSLSKNKGPFTGWMSYTLSKATNYIDEINGGKSYVPVYDRPHSLKAVVNYRLNEKWSFSSTFALRSGMNITMPIGQYNYQGAVFYEYTERNGYRAPLFHQLDLAINFTPPSRKRWKSEWSVGVLNAYNRKNVFSMYAGRKDGSLNWRGAYKMYLYGILPFISYNFKF